MKPEIKTKWLEALRSGKYKQTQKYLKVKKEDNTCSYCCLGVLCELAGATAIEIEPTQFRQLPFFSYQYQDTWSNGVLPAKLSEELGFHPTGQVSVTPDNEFFSTELGRKVKKQVSFENDNYTLELTWLNDNGFTFEEIAQIIERFF